MTDPRVEPGEIQRVEDGYVQLARVSFAPGDTITLLSLQTITARHAGVVDAFREVLEDGHPVGPYCYFYHDHRAIVTGDGTTEQFRAYAAARKVQN